MKFNIDLPLGAINPPGEFQSTAAVRELAQAIQNTRASACGVTEHPAPDADWLHNDVAGHDAVDPYAALAFVAAMTTRLKVVSHLAVLPFRNPFISAKAAATLQVLSDGRFIFGVGMGYLKGEIEALGVPKGKRGAMMDEAIDTIQQIWRGGSVVKRGLTFNAIGNEPRPVPNPAPPIWVGGGSLKAAERSARCDGWYPFFTPTGADNPNLKSDAVTSAADLKQKIAHVKEMREKLGKTTQFDVCLYIPVDLIELTPARARQYLEVAEELGEAGVTWATAILPHPSRSAFLENLRWFDAEIMSHFDK
jgi:probable F420-dependent oxidoreductase